MLTSRDLLVRSSTRQRKRHSSKFLTLRTSLKPLRYIHLLRARSPSSSEKDKADKKTKEKLLLFSRCLSKKRNTNILVELMDQDKSCCRFLGLLRTVLKGPRLDAKGTLKHKACELYIYYTIILMIPSILIYYILIHQSRL